MRRTAASPTPRRRCVAMAPSTWCWWPPGCCTALRWRLKSAWPTWTPRRWTRCSAPTPSARRWCCAHFAPLLDRQRSLLGVLSAKVGSIGDNRLGGWYGYRASKAALNMLLKTAAIELRRTHPGAVLAALHPGTVRSALSRPFRGDEIGHEPAAGRGRAAGGAGRPAGRGQRRLRGLQRRAPALVSQAPAASLARILAWM